MSTLPSSYEADKQLIESVEQTVYIFPVIQFHLVRISFTLQLDSFIGSSFCSLHTHLLSLFFQSNMNHFGFYSFFIKISNVLFTHSIYQVHTGTARHLLKISDSIPESKAEWAKISDMTRFLSYLLYMFSNSLSYLIHPQPCSLFIEYTHLLWIY